MIFVGLDRRQVDRVVERHACGRRARRARRLRASPWSAAPSSRIAVSTAVFHAVVRAERTIGAVSGAARVHAAALAARDVPRSCRARRGTTRATCSRSSTAPTRPASRPLLPPGVDLAEDDPGAVAIIWADWQSCSDAGAELLDPVRSQYKEAFVVVRCAYAGETYSRCVLDLGRQGLRARARLVPGLPEEARPDLDDASGRRSGKAGPRLEPGGAVRRDARRERPSARRGRRSRSRERARPAGS